MKAKGGVIDQIKAEIQAQSEGQDEILELSFQDIKIEKFTPEISSLLSSYPKLSTSPFISLIVSLPGDQLEWTEDT